MTPLRCALAAFLTFVACSSSKTADSPTQPVDNPTSPVTAAGSGAVVASPKRGTVTFKLASGDKTVNVEVVKSELAIQKGLMYRQYMAPDEGMLFLMGETKEQTFWMRNTLIALDMLFITADFEITGIVENATPKTDDIRTVGKPSLYVLEMNGGWCKANGVTAGGKVVFANLEAAAH